MTEENARHGNAAMPEVPPAAESGERYTAAAPRAVPPRPSTPPTSATLVVPPAEPSSEPRPAEPRNRPFVPPVARVRERNVRPGSRGASSARAAGSAAAASARTAGLAAGKFLSEQAARLGGWVHRHGAAKVAAGVAAVVVLALILWWLTSLSGSPKPSAAGSSPAPAGTSSSSAAPANRGPLPLAAVVPLDFQLGDCFKDFDPEAPTSTVVDCATGHSAQLIAVDHYQESDAYPGRDPLKQKSLDACKAAPLTDKQAEYVLSFKLAYPSSTSWDNGDRRVDCYVTADTGNVIMESLLP